jgi:hypothetical protein
MTEFATIETVEDAVVRTIAFTEAILAEDSARWPAARLGIGIILSDLARSGFGGAAIVSLRRYVAAQDAANEGIGGRKKSRLGSRLTSSRRGS